MSVYIKNVKIRNFRSVKDEDFDLAVPNGKSGSGMTIIVGPNNVGKSNVVRAIDSLFNKFSLDDKTHGESGHTEVQIEFTSEDFTKSIETYVPASKQTVYKANIQEDGSYHAKRSDNEGISKILLKKLSGDFKNDSGIDAPFGAWMKCRTVGPDLRTDDATKYTSTSILGDLLGKIFQEIEGEEKYEQLKQTFKELFEEDSVFEEKSEAISTKVSGFMKNFYGEVGVNFIPERPDLSQLTKNVKTVVRDGSHDSDVSEKGSGLQRAIILALIQTYADSFEDAEHKKPFFLILDEPELSLSAQGQKKLLEALRIISQKEQVVIITHSPYFVNWDDLANGARIARATRTTSDGTKLHWLQSTERYSSLISGSVKQWQKPYVLDVAAKEVLFTDSVLLLEGQEDVGLIRMWATKNGIELGCDIFGYGVQGFDNFRPFLQMAADSGLTKVAALYDNGEEEVARIAEDSELYPDYKLMQLSANDIRDKFKPCAACDKCRDDTRKCKSRVQIKDGCFDEHGKEKSGSENLEDLKSKCAAINEYMGA